MSDLTKIIRLIDNLVVKRLSVYKSVPNEYHECGMCNFGEGRYIMIYSHNVQFTASALKNFDFVHNHDLIDAIVEFILWKTIRCHKVIIDGSHKTYIYEGFKINQFNRSYCCGIEIDF